MLTFVWKVEKQWWTKQWWCLIQNKAMASNHTYEWYSSPTWIHSKHNPTHMGTHACKIKTISLTKALDEIVKIILLNFINFHFIKSWPFIWLLNILWDEMGYANETFCCMQKHNRYVQVRYLGNSWRKILTFSDLLLCLLLALICSGICK